LFSAVELSGVYHFRWPSASCTLHGNQALAWKCVCIGLLSLLLLVSAMTDRGATST
jgi:hypothetical protein